MTEGLTAVAGEQAVAPAIETQQQETVMTPDAKDDPIDLDAPQEEEDIREPDPEGGEQPAVEGAEPDMVEIELNGKKYNVPSELKDGYLMHADYTRKTQEVAEVRKAAERQQEEATALFQSSQEFIQANAALMNLDNQLEQYANVDWNKLEQEDPMAAMSHWRQFQQLQGQRSQVAQYLEKTHNERNAKAEQEIANRLQETRQFAEKDIPGWNEAIDAEIVRFAESVGFSRDQLRAALNPQIYRMMHLAWVGSQVLQKQQATPKQTAIAQKPLKTVSAKASPAVTREPEDMSMSEYVAFRQAQMKRR